ncbi:glycosyltransferase family 39 protein [Anaerolineales bacterium HSG6]|nr:glycosyltransferase family 39 protein [Anaerolineales bacterium HSG6]
MSQRFHHDEALYATWALQIATGQDFWLAETIIDKPPLFIYLIAGFMWLLGPTETVARLASLLLTGGIVGLTYWWGRRLYNPSIGILAAWLVALSPFTIMFAPTVFTDPLLVFLILLGCLLISYQQFSGAGFCLGLAFATKQQAIFFAPLLLGCMALVWWQTRLQSRHNQMMIGKMFHFLLGIMVVMGGLFLWELQRVDVPDFLTHSASNYGGLYLDGANFAERLTGFLELLWYGTGSSMLNTLCIVGVFFLLGQSFWLDLTPTMLTDWLLFLFGVTFLLVHSLLTFQIWDRYLLGLIPIMALLFARALFMPISMPFTRLSVFQISHPMHHALRIVYYIIITILLMITLWQPVQDAVSGRYPLGSNSGTWAGIDQIVNYLHGQYGDNVTLHHRWLGTHWRFYLSGYPYDLQYWSTPSDLHDKAKPGDLIAFPSWRSDTEARLMLAEKGLFLHDLHRAFNPLGVPTIILYKIETVP